MADEELTDAQKERSAIIDAELDRLWKLDNGVPLSFEEVLCRTAWYTAIFTKYWPNQVEVLAILSQQLFERLNTSKDIFSHTNWEGRRDN